MRFNSSTGLYSFQLDEQWFNHNKDILRDALDITPTNDNNPFVALPSSDTVIKYVNTLRYPSTLKNMSAMSVNALYQPWRAILSMINMCLTGKTSGFDRPRHHVLQILKNLAAASHGKKKITHLLIPSIRYVGKDGREVFGMLIPDALLTNEIKRAPYYGATESSKATKVIKPKAAKDTKPASDPKPKPTPTQPPKAAPEKKQKLLQKTTPDEPSPAKRSKGGLVRKIRKPMSLLKLVDELSAEDVPVEEPAYNVEESNLQRALELSLKEQAERTQGLARPVNLKNKSPVDQFILQRRTHMPAEASRPVESPSMDAKLAMIDSETESDEEVPKINTGDQDEGQARRNPGIQDEGQAGPNPGVQDEGHARLNPSDVAECTITAYPNVQENLKLPSEDLMIPEEPTSFTGTLSSLQNLEKELNFTDQFSMEKQQEEEPGKTNAKAEVQSMVSGLIHQDTSAVPLMTTLVLDLTTSKSGSPLPTSSTTTSTVITTTTTLPLPPQPQQNTTDPTLMKRIDELE
nr:hypothetical protein [Tanacetum cinerariifolium]